MRMENIKMTTRIHNKTKNTLHYIVTHKSMLYGLFTFILVMSILMMPLMSVNAAKDNKTKIVKKNKDFKVSAEYGMGGYVLYDIPMQAVVTIESSKDFSGILQIMGDVDFGETVSAYGKRITLAAGEAKTFKLAAKPPTSTGVVRLIILNDKEKPVYEEQTTIEMSGSGDNALLGVLSDDYAGLGYLNGISYSISVSNEYETVSTMEFNKDSFPDNAQLLKSLNYLVIDNFDTSTLSEKQFNALKQWVADGGILILSLGSHYQNVLSGFKDDFVSGTIKDLNKKNLKWNDAEQEYAIDGVDCIDFELNDGVEMTMHTDSRTTFRRSYGLGKVVVLSYSLSMEPFANWQDRKNIVTMLLEETNDNASISVARDRANNLNNYLLGLVSIAENAKKPSALLYGLLLAVYVVFVGPVLYLILKKKNNREKIWMAIPIASLVFTGIIYCTSFLYRVNKPLFNSLTLIQASEGGAKETVYSELVCPSAKRYDIKMNNEYTGFQNSYNQYDYSVFGNNNKSKDWLYDTMFLENGTDNELIFNSDSAFDKFDFSVSRVLKDGVGDVTLDIECDWNYIRGSITNNTVYDLLDVVVTYEGMVYQAGDMKKGETVEIDETKIINSTGYGTFDNVTNPSGYSDTGKLYQIDSAMIQSIDVENYNHGYVWGTVEAYKPEVVDTQQAKTSGMAIIFDSYYKEKSSGVTGSYSSIAPMIVDSQGDYDYETGLIYGNEAILTYSFEGYGDINTLKPMTEGYGGTDNVNQIADCYAMNTDSGEYEPVFENGAELSGGELNKYLSHGVLILKFSKPDNSQNGGYYDYVIPRIAAFSK